MSNQQISSSQINRSVPILLRFFSVIILIIGMFFFFISAIGFLLPFDYGFDNKTYGTLLAAICFTISSIGISEKKFWGLFLFIFITAWSVFDYWVFPTTDIFPATYNHVIPVPIFIIAILFFLGLGWVSKSFVKTN